MCITDLTESLKAPVLFYTLRFKHIFRPVSYSEDGEHFITVFLLGKLNQWTGSVPAVAPGHMFALQALILG